MIITEISGMIIFFMYVFVDPVLIIVKRSQKCMQKSSYKCLHMLDDTCHFSVTL